MWSDLGRALQPHVADARQLWSIWQVQFNQDLFINVQEGRRLLTHDLYEVSAAHRCGNEHSQEPKQAQVDSKCCTNQGDPNFAARNKETLL